MKTPYEWKLEFEANLENFETDYVAMIEAIQCDALTDPMASTNAEQEISILKDACNQLEAKNARLENELERLREKLRERKHYLRAANKGAERNAEALQLATRQYWDMVHSDKRWKDRDQHKHETIVWNWLLLADVELCEKANISLLDVGAARSLLKAMLGTSILKHL